MEAPEALPEMGMFPRKEIYYEGEMYDVTDWIPNHPGGKIIEFYTEAAEDSTLPIQQFHHRSMKQVLARMETFKKSAAPVNRMIYPKINAWRVYFKNSW